MGETNSMIPILSNIAYDFGMEGKELMDKIRDENKAGEYTVSPIVLDIKEGVVVTNANTIKEQVNLLIGHTQDLVKSGTLKELEDHKEIVGSLGTWIKNNRIKATKPFDEIKKSFTSIEAEFKTLNNDITNAVNLLMEQEYKIAENNITDYLEELIKESGLNIDLKVFNDFVSVKRKTKGMRTLTKSNELSAPNKKIIKDQFDLVANPILEAKELELKKDLEFKQFNMALENAGNEAQLEDLRGFIDDLYPNIVDSANRAIRAKLDAIKVRRFEAEKREREDLLKSKEEKILVVAKEIYDLSRGLADIDQLEGLMQELKIESEKCESNKVIAKINSYALEIRGEIDVLTAREEKEVSKIEKSTEDKSDLFEVDATNEIDATKCYKLSDEDIEFISTLESKKSDMEEAKADILSQIETHFMFVTLEEK